jgi:hypothetical protein
MFGRVTEEQCKTELVESALAGNFSGKTNENFAGGGKSLLICEPRSRIDNVNGEPNLAGKRGHRHRYLTRAKNEEIRTKADDLDEDLHLRLPSFARRLKGICAATELSRSFPKDP